MIVLNKFEILKVSALAVGEVDIAVSYAMVKGTEETNYAAYASLSDIGTVDIALNEVPYNNSNPSDETRIISYLSVTNKSAITQTIELDIGLYNGATLGRLFRFTLEENEVKIFNGDFWVTASGSGMSLAAVEGPLSSVDERIAVFDGITGKLIKDGGFTIAEVLNCANHTGTLADSRLSSNVVLENATNDFTAAQEISVNGAASTPALKLDGTIFTGGTGTTTTPQLLIEPAGTTSTNWSSAGTMLGVNSPSGFSGNLLDVKINNSASARFSVNQNGIPNAPSGIYIQSNTGSLQFGSSLDTFLTRDSAAASIRMGSNSATPIAQTFKGPDARAGTDTNTVGGVLNIGAGRSTGNALPPELRFQTSEPTVSGSAAQTLTTRLAISGTAITASKPVVLPEYTLAQLNALTGLVSGMNAICSDATAPTYLGAITGGGAVKCPAIYNGSAWVSH